MSIHEQSPKHDSLMELYRQGCQLRNILWPLIQDRAQRLLGCPIDVNDLIEYADACKNGTGKTPDDEEAVFGISGALGMSLGLVSRLSAASLSQLRTKPDQPESLIDLSRQLIKAQEFCRSVNDTFPDLVLAILPQVDDTFTDHPEDHLDLAKSKGRTKSQMDAIFSIALANISQAPVKARQW